MDALIEQLKYGILYVCVGVGICVCPISSKVLRTGTEYFTLMKSDPNSDSAADDMTNFMICDIFRTTPLFRGKHEFLKIK